ncbi:hypothetical protein BV898_01725 [Hypsibius exemplaris]|uniref:Ubiquitin-like domain-containing protein n=1 Tax=Hypsibius exemplaris TaxID=2072580 RepID=A0A1W0XAV9_HYPEX|nr:hypothetical protein BV898_01725 [Hypsibius exemplaris]
MPNWKNPLSADGRPLQQPLITSLDPRATNQLPPGVSEELFGDDYDPALEAEINEFYRTVLPEEEGSLANSEEEWKDDCEGLDVVPRLQQPDDPVEFDPALDMSPRMAQLEILAQANQPCVFLTIHRMFESYELQLWDVVPLATVKDLLEDLTEMSPQDMRIYQKNGTLLDDAKLLKDYGVEAGVHTCENPAKFFVGFRVDLEDISDDEQEEEEDEGDADIELSPGLEYFETVSDIDFTNEIQRDRDFDDWNQDVDGTAEYTVIRPDGAGEPGLNTFLGARAATARGKSIKAGDKSSLRPGLEEVALEDSDEEEFIPFTLKK